MTALPQQIIPQSTPLGRLREDGVVIIDHNWWLLFYNICQSLGIGQLDPAALVALEGADGDAQDSDAIALQRPLQNALTLASADVPPVTDLPSIARALLLAQDVVLPDPVPRAQPVASITVGVSPFTYTAPFSGAVTVTSGTVSAVSIIRQGVTVATGQTAGIFPVSRLDQLQVTYSVAPTMRFLPT